ncbi:MAG: hypothetical protein IPJ12_05885 [Betaproteobacteria bacterium]|nr:hypothetical protein [Betaproteobacteria bacterium]PKO89557.1 MAG: hypothetical protein CVU16_11780 [Betaproteobacteria bacterium HGW-Betaproteobacteria-10]
MLDEQNERKVTKAERPMRDLMLLMPHLPIRDKCEIDYEAADADLLVDIARHAETTLRTVHLGTSAIGELLVYASPEIGTGEFPANTIEAIGWLLADLGDLAATAHLLMAGCQHYTSDYAPRKAKHIPPARP